MRNSLPELNQPLHENHRKNKNYRGDNINYNNSSMPPGGLRTAAEVDKIHMHSNGKTISSTTKSAISEIIPDTLRPSPSLTAKFSQLALTSPTSPGLPASNLPIHRTVPSIRLEAPCERATQECALESQYTPILDNVLHGVTEIPNSTTDETSPCDSVTLPCRYRRQIIETEEQMTSQSRDVSNDNDMLTREKDLGTALKWIRQEILQMKEQDKSLLKQFIELRASILQLRCLYDMHGSCSDVSSLDGSTYSLNEPAKSPRLRRLVLEGDSCLGKPSISLPNSPRVARFKWRSDEFI